MQTKYAESDAFSVVLSYVQSYDASVKEFLSKNAGSIPSFNQLQPPGAPCGGGIPDAYLFDHEGRIVAHGHPAELYPLVAALVAAVPPTAPKPILADFEAVLLQAEARALQDPVRPAAPVLSSLDTLAAIDDARGQEARAMAAAVREWMLREVERQERMAKRAPAQTADEARQFTARFKGADRALEARVSTLAATLAKVTGVKEFLRAVDDLARAAAAKDKQTADQFTKRARATLEQVAGNPKTSAEVRDAARSLLRN